MTFNHLGHLKPGADRVQEAYLKVQKWSNVANVSVLSHWNNNIIIRFKSRRSPQKLQEVRLTGLTIFFLFPTIFPIEDGKFGVKRVKFCLCTGAWFRPVGIARINALTWAELPK